MTIETPAGLSPEQSAQRPNFNTFGKNFQEKVVQGLLTDSRWAEQMTEVLDASFFDLKYLEFLADRFFSYAKKYKTYPSLGLLVTIIKEDLKSSSDLALKGQIVDYLTRMRAEPDLGDLPYVKDRSLEFCKKQALKAALEAAVDDIAADKYESIVERLKKAVSLGTSSSPGTDLEDDVAARYVVTARNPVPTGKPELDKKGMLSGGLGKGELGVVCAPTGVGKSHMLVDFGCAALKLGIDVVHYSFELAESQIGIRYDSNLVGFDADDAMTSEALTKEYYTGMSGKNGRLKIKYYPTNTATIFTLRAHLERLSLNAFRPGLVLIDYADIMRSTRQYEQLRLELKLIYEELRGLGGELGIPIWTASQSNKEGSSSDIVDLSNMSEAYGKAMVADVVLGLSRKPQEKALGTGRIYVAKNRAGRDGVVFPVKINTARSKITITGDAGSVDEAKVDDDQSMKRRLRDKLGALKSDPLIRVQDVIGKPVPPAIDAVDAE